MPEIVIGIITMAEWSVLKDVLKLAWTETDVPDSLTATPSVAEFLDVTHHTWLWEPQSVPEKMTALLLEVMVVKSTISTEILLLLLRKKKPLKKKILKMRWTKLMNKR